MRPLRPQLLFVLALVACGEDEAPSGPPPPMPGQPSPGVVRGPAPPAPGGAAAVARLKVEDRVTDPDERATIRHQFKDRDFAVDQSNRDPFQSFVLAQGLPQGGDAMLPREITKECRENNTVASNYSYTDLRLVGIVAERAQRKVLMMDAGNLGHIIKKGDCVGREKAIVKEIGAGYITFVIQPEDALTGQPRTAEEHSVQLYPNQMPLASQPRLDEPTRSTAPAVAPPGAAPTRGVPIEPPPGR